MLVPVRPARQVARFPLRFIQWVGPWWGSRKAHRFGLAPVSQPRYVPAHPFATSAGRIRESTGNLAMSKPAETPYMYPRLAVKPAEFKRLAADVLETTRIYVERLSALAAMARILRNGIAGNHYDRRDQIQLAGVLEQTAKHYETEAKIERGKMSIVLHDAEESEANLARREQGTRLVASRTSARKKAALNAEAKPA